MTAHSTNMKIRKTFGQQFHISILGLTALSTIYTASCSYLNEPPIKLLTVDSFAVRFPAAKSQYRTSIKNGKVIMQKDLSVFLSKQKCNKSTISF